MDGLLSKGPFLYRIAFLTCFRSFWCLFRIPFFTAGYGDDAKHKVAGAGGEERGGGGNQPLGKVTVNIFNKGERVVMHKDISAYPPPPESFNKKPKDWKNAITMAEMALENNE